MNSLLWIPFYLILIGRIDDSKAVAYGTPAANDAFRHMAYISETPSGVSCGGAILSKRYVLTAAHCVDCATVKNLWVLAGAADLAGPTRQLRKVSEVHIHQKFRALNSDKLSFLRQLCLNPKAWKKVAIKNDVAVLRLKHSLDLNGMVAPVSLPTASSSFANIPTLFAGWGLNEHGHLVSHLHYIMLIAVTKGMTKEMHLASAKNQFDVVTINGQSHTTAGDSGSPFVINGQVYGVLSTGSNKADVSSVFTKIYPYIDFIKTVMKKK